MSAIAIVTGAARGIGLAIAQRLARDGFTVVATDRDVDKLSSEDVDAIAMDVTDRAAVSAVMRRVGPVTVVVNNACVGAPMVPFDKLTRAELRGIIEINTKGTFIVAQEAVRDMPAGGRIINIASRGYLGGAGAGHYVASKAAVVGLTRALAVELRWRGINVNAVAPGMVDTPMISDFTAQEMSALLKREPSGKAASPASIADVVSFLASPSAAAINGQVIFADGGKTVGMPTL